MAVHYGRNFAAYARDDFINVYISMIKPKAYHIRANKSWAKKWLPEKSADISQVN